MDGTIVLEGTLTKVTSSRAQKAELTIGKVEVCFQVRDPEQVGLLTMLQNGIVRVTIENPQMEMFRRQAEAENRQQNFEFEEAAFGEQTQEEEVRCPVGHEEETEESPQDEDSPLGEEVTAEELEEN